MHLQVRSGRKELSEPLAPCERVARVAVIGLQQRIEQQIRIDARLQSQLAGGQPASHLKWIQASMGQQIQMIPVEEALFFVSDEKYTRVQTAQQEALIRKPIKELIAELERNQFWQIHRSTLVNAHAVAGVSRDVRGRQLVSVKGSNEKLEVSRSYTHLFKGI